MQKKQCESSLNIDIALTVGNKTPTDEAEVCAGRHGLDHIQQLGDLVAVRQARRVEAVGLGELAQRPLGGGPAVDAEVEGLGLVLRREGEVRGDAGPVPGRLLEGDGVEAVHQIVRSDGASSIRANARNDLRAKQYNDKYIKTLIFIL